MTSTLIMHVIIITSTQNKIAWLEEGRFDS
jgi:hypothetical protein